MLIDNSNAKRLAIFFFYDRGGIVDSYVPYLLEDLKKNVSEIFVVCNGKLKEEGKKELEKYGKVLVRENKGFDVWAYKTALETYGWKKLEEFDPMFIEEPVLCENMEYFPEIAAACNIPIATGERLFSKYDFKRLLKIGGVDIIQPDLSHAGGLTEVRKIASMAEAFDVALAPHCPLGPIALASCLNVDAVSYNAVIQEQSIGIHYNVGKSVLDYVKNQEDFQFQNGFVDLPVKPGLGVEVNKDLVLQENQNPHHWKNPVWRHADGSIAEW